uniref:Uncharacterized protein n=1 Tax=Avena sativa TaxID=4498 RepID=A0ACD6APJ3_AVESA
MEANVINTLAAILAISLISTRALWHLVWRPCTVARCFARQGIQGPPYRFLTGSVWEIRRMLVAGREKGPLATGCHDYTSLVNPFFHKWVSYYGKTFLYWIGPIPAICSTDMELVKQVLEDRTGLFQKEYLNPSLEGILGNGVISANGDDWRRHRRIVYPIFNHENLKSLFAMVWDGTQNMIEQWLTQIEKGDGHQTQLNMRPCSEELTLGIIEQVIFGKKYKEAREAFAAGKELQKLAVYAFADPPVPGFRYLPTRRNRRSWKLEKLVTAKVTQIIRARVAEFHYGHDLLGLMLRACRKDAEILSIKEIIGECVTFFAAGQDTTANLLTWGMFLLSIYPQWQQQVREEVLREWPDDGKVPSMDVLGKLNLVCS